VALSKTVFINRTNRALSRATFDTAAQTMTTARQSVFIFPEGTRSYASDPMLLPFKKGAFHLAVQAQVPIIPVVCANYNHILDVKKRRVRPGVVDVTVDTLVEKTRKAMLDELIRLSHVSGEDKEGVPLPSASGVDDETRELRKRH
jgi:lysophosphatidate acyltransferase